MSLYVCAAGNLDCCPVGHAWTFCSVAGAHSLPLRLGCADNRFGCAGIGGQSHLFGAANRQHVADFLAFEVVAERLGFGRRLRPR